MQRVDLSGFSYEEWLAFVFDRPVADPPWYAAIEWDCEEGPPAEALARHLARLFCDPRQLTRRYTLAQIEQGLGYLASAGGLVAPIVRAPSIPWALRQEVVEAMQPLFEELLAVAPLDVVALLWWEELTAPPRGGAAEAGGAGPDEASRAASAQPEGEPRLQGAVLQALRAALALPSVACQQGALYGLSRLDHPGAHRLIEEFLLSRADLPPSLRAYAVGCIESDRRASARAAP